MPKQTRQGVEDDDEDSLALVPRTSFAGFVFDNTTDEDFSVNLAAPESDNDDFTSVGSDEDGPVEDDVSGGGAPDTTNDESSELPS